MRQQHRQRESPMSKCFASVSANAFTAADVFAAADTTIAPLLAAAADTPQRCRTTVVA